MANIYTVEKKIKGTKYVAQFNGISAALRAVDNSYIEGRSTTSLKKLSEYLFANVIVEPKIAIDDFGKDKIGEEATKTIGGVEYVAKFKGLSTALEAIDNSYCDDADNISTEKLSAFLFDRVIVKPTDLTADDFDSMEDFNAVVSFARETMQGGDAMDEFNEVVAFAREVMQGNFRDKKAVEKTTKAKSKA